MSETERLFAPDQTEGPLGRIAHALGGIDGLAYSNSREAFLSSCNRGFRLLEVDLAVVRAGEIVCYHEQDGGLSLPDSLSELDRRAFLDLRYARKYSPLDLDALLALLAENDDVRLITDTKDRNRQILPRVIEQADRFQTNMLARIIPQAYSEDDVLYLEELGVFPTIVFTCYLCNYSDRELLSLAASTGIAMMAMFPRRYHVDLKQRLHASGCGVYVHTINDPDQASAYRAAGVGVYTDFC